jgi:RNA polymerase sigma-70 factor, ECF subfamily
MEDLEERATIATTPRELSVESVFRAHFDDVYGMVGRLLGPGAQHADIEDITQQVFIVVQRALPEFRGECKTTTWLYAIASKVVLTSLRSWRRQRRLSAAVAAELHDIASHQTPEQTVHGRQELVRVWRCLLKVKPKKRIVYILHMIEGMSGAEISQALDIPESTVWTRLHHARLELNKALERANTERLP